jgi:hypothetical protein
MNRLLNDLTIQETQTELRNDLISQLHAVICSALLSGGYIIAK